MNKRLLALGVAVALILLVVLLNVIFRKHASSGDVCKDFIITIQKGKAKTGYGMLSDKAQSATSLSTWEKQVDALKVAYLNGTTTKKTSDSIPVADNQTPQMREIYEVKSGSSKYQATCFITNGKLDAFDSQPIY